MGAPTIGLLLGLAAFVVYWRTLAVSIVWGDSPELAAAAYTGGVPHPSGYPLYMLLSRAYLWMTPWGSVAYRMNLLSALCAALAVALIYPLMLRVIRSRVIAAVTTLLFAFTHTFWSQAVIAEVYAFHMLGTAAVLVLLLTWDRRGDRRWLWAAAVTYGCCFTHHLMSALLAPGLLFFALTSRHRGQFRVELRRTVPLFLLPLSLYAYLPLAARSGSPVNWGDPSTWDRFVGHVTGRQYHGAMFHLTGAQVWEQLRDYLGWGARPGHLRQQFGLGLLWLAPVGLWSLARRQRRLAALTLLITLAGVGYALNYDISDLEAYYLPAHLMVALWIGCGLRQIAVCLAGRWQRSRRAPVQRRPIRAALAAALCVLPLVPLGANWAAIDKHDHDKVIVYTRAVLASVRPNAVVITGEDQGFFALQYVRYVEGRRPDVTLFNQYDALCPERRSLMARLAACGVTVRFPACCRGEHAKLPFHLCLLKQVVEDNIDRRPLYLLGEPVLWPRLGVREMLAPYTQVERTNLRLVELSRSGPNLAAAPTQPGAPPRATFGSRQPDGRVTTELELLNCRLQAVWKEGVPWLQARYDWRLQDEGLARSVRVWVLFTDANGGYRTKADGSPELHNIHPLAYGLGKRGRLSKLLSESYEIHVPSAAWKEPLHARIAVARGEEFLASGTGREPWVRLGEVSLPAQDGSLRVAEGEVRRP